MKLPIFNLAGLLVACVASPAPFIEVDNLIVTTGDMVSVSFGGIQPEDRKHCWIGLISPADALVVASDPTKSKDYPSRYDHTEMPYTATAPVKWLQCADADASFSDTGTGAHAFQLINRRQDARFWLFLNGTESPVQQASTKRIVFTDQDAPQHTRIALTSKAGEMLVAWTSAGVSLPTLRWGAAPGSYQHAVAASSSSFAPDDLCGAPANAEGWFHPGFTHHATITGLTPGQTIYYSVGSISEGFTPEKAFKATQLVGPDRETRILIAADVGITEPDNSRQHWSVPTDPAGQERQANLTLQCLQQAPQADVLLHVGDLSYATGFLSKWNRFMYEIESVASRTPYMVCPGNHERDFPGTGSNGESDSGGECGVPTEHLFHTPASKQDDTWYSFDVGSVHVVMMDTERTCATDGAQFQWLQQDLGAVDRGRTPWVVLAGHRPMYRVEGNVSYGPDLSSAYCLEAQGMEALLVTNQVDVALWGHVHNILTTCPVIDGACVTADKPGEYAGPIHVVIGHGGQNQTPIPSKEHMPKWGTFTANPFGFADMTAHNSTHLTVRIFENLPESELNANGLPRGREEDTGTVVTQFTVVRNFPRA